VRVVAVRPEDDAHLRTVFGAGKRLGLRLWLGRISVRLTIRVKRWRFRVELTWGLGVQVGASVKGRFGSDSACQDVS